MVNQEDSHAKRVENRKNMLKSISFENRVKYDLGLGLNLKLIKLTPLELRGISITRGKKEYHFSIEKIDENYRLESIENESFSQCFDTLEDAISEAYFLWSD